MNNMNLPETYMGYSTKELLVFWERYCQGKERNAPVEKIRAMDSLLREYKIAPVFRNPGAVCYLKTPESTEEELERLCRAIQRLDINPGANAAKEHLEAGRPIYGSGYPGLAKGELLKEYPDGRKEVVRLERGTRKDIFVRHWE
jgi:hypothetical protein